MRESFTEEFTRLFLKAIAIGLLDWRYNRGDLTIRFELSFERRLASRFYCNAAGSFHY